MNQALGYTFIIKLLFKTLFGYPILGKTESESTFYLKRKSSAFCRPV